MTSISTYHCVHNSKYKYTTWSAFWALIWDLGNKVFGPPQKKKKNEEIPYCDDLDPMIYSIFLAVPDSSPRDVTVVRSNSSTSVFVSWQPPIHTNGDIIRKLQSYILVQCH